MAAYLIASYDVVDQDKMNQYRAKAVPIAREFGATPLLGHEFQTIEGKPSNTVFVLRFDTMEKLQEWYSSAEYSDARPLRDQAVENCWIVASDEFQPPK